MTRDERDPISGVVLEAAIAVHRTVGPGLLESVYQACLAHELRKRGVPFEANRRVPFQYDGVELELHFQLDFLVAGELVVELKSVERLNPVHLAQVLTYLRLTDHRRALLVNFNVARLMDGVRRVSLSARQSPAFPAPLW